jgi:hypothetical protein
MSFAIEAGLSANVTRVGRDALPVICIDGFARDPQALVALAAEAAFIDVGSNYPGVRAPAPSGYASAVLSALTPLIQGVFGAAPEAELDLCAYSMVTTRPAALRPIQRIPHFDGPEPGRIALLHYLCGAEQGGTSFYRHRATGFEAVTPERLGAYRERATAELRALPPASEFAGGEMPHFERIHTVAAAFNRLVVYRGHALHSGDIGPGTVFSEDPHRGRLTINGFGFLRS